MGQRNPKFGIIKIYVDGDGEVVKVTDAGDNPLTTEHYVEGEKKKIDQHGVLASENWCRWVLVGGQWQ